MLLYGAKFCSLAPGKMIENPINPLADFRVLFMEPRVFFSKPGGLLLPRPYRIGRRPGVGTNLLPLCFEFSARSAQIVKLSHYICESSFE